MHYEEEKLRLLLRSQKFLRMPTSLPPDRSKERKVS